MNILHRYSLATLCLLVVASGCGKKAQPRSTVGHDLPSPLISHCEPGKRGGRFTLVTPGAPRTFNPLVITDTASDAVTRLLFAGLVNTDWATQEPGPGLAESWSVEPDQRMWTFKLRQGLRWSDGEPLTADDVVFTWNEIMLNPELNPATFGVFVVDGKPFSVTKVDDQTVRVVTATPFAPFLNYFGSVWILPQHTLESAVKSHRFLTAYNLGTSVEKIVGCGPFRVAEVKPGQFTLLERNPEYWMADTNGQRLPYFDDVLLYVGGEGVAQGAFLGHKCDVYEQGRPEEYAVFQIAVTNEQFRLKDLGMGSDRDFLWFNENTGADLTGKPLVAPAKLGWFRNKKFRQAISSAIDREKIVRENYGGRAKAIYTFMSDENAKWSNPDAARFPHDPQKALALLAEIGIKDRNGDGLLEDEAGAPVEFALLTNTRNAFRERQAGLIAEDLRRIGIKADVQLVEFRTLMEKVNATHDYDCVLMGLGGGGADPASQINVLKSDQPLHQWFPNQPKPSTEWEARVDQLMDEQMRTLDLAQRKKLFDEIQVIIADQQPMISTVSPFHFAAYRPDLANVRATALNTYRVTWNAQELYFKP